MNDRDMNDPHAPLLPPETGEGRYSIPRHILRDLVTAIQWALGGDGREEWFTQKIGKHRVKFEQDFPLWQMPSIACYMKSLIDDNTETVDFVSGKRVSPSFNTFEYKRGSQVTGLVDGYQFIHYNDVPIIIYIATSNRAYITVHGNAEYEDIVRSFFDTFKSEVSSLDHLKGEKMLVTSHNTFKFLNYEKVTREDIILKEDIWELIDKNFFFLINNKELILSHKLDWKRGILIWGPPGTGKTLFGKLLCNETPDMTLLWVTPRCIEDDDDVSKLFTMARMLSPSVIFFEDIDFFAADREEYGYTYVLGELLTQLDGLSPNDGVFVIGTTNKPLALDTAIGSRPSRFDVKIQFPLPDTTEREMMYRRFLDNPDIDYKVLASLSDKMTGAHIKETCVRGTISKLRDNSLSLDKAISDSISELKEEEFGTKPPENWYQ